MLLLILLGTALVPTTVHNIFFIGSEQRACVSVCVCARVCVCVGRLQGASAKTSVAMLAYFLFGFGLFFKQDLPCF